MNNKIIEVAEALIRAFKLKHQELLKSSPSESELTKQMEEFVNDPFFKYLCPLNEVSEESVQIFKDTIRQQCNVTFEEGVIITSHRFKPWTASRWRESDPYYWNSYEQYLTDELKRPLKLVNQLDRKTDDILDHCGNPVDIVDPWICRGLVVGEVQSGKTGVYTGLISKAADAGYKIIIVMTGMLENLRQQTQRRLEHEFIGRTGTIRRASKHGMVTKEGEKVGVGFYRRADGGSLRFPVSLTTEESDFSRHSAWTENFDLRALKEPAILVIKKNAKILKNIVKWLKSKNIHANEKITEPLFLIDDESDNASINTKSEDEDPTQINQQIRDLLGLFRNATYVGFTATPYANVLIDSDIDDDLFPKDFIQLTDIPSNYFGLNRMLGQENEEYDESIVSCGDHVRLIEDGDDAIPVVHKAQDTILLNESMKTAVIQFLLVNAIRDLRGEDKTHRTMMINPSRFTALQNSLAEQVEDYLEQVRVNIRNSSSDLNPTIHAIHEQFKDEYSDCGQTWEDVLDKLPASCRSIRVFCVNRSRVAKKNPLDYEGNSTTGLRAIVVGGLGLSRGLTLEGLCISYLYRSTICADTLTQMGRWFGYRDPYLDLCRIWLTEELLTRFRKTAVSQSELKVDIRNMSDLDMTPEQWGMKIRYTPGAFAITNRNKMRHGETKRINIKQIFSECLIETTALPKRRRQNNETQARAFWKKLRSLHLPMHFYRDDVSKPWFEGVPKAVVAEFVRSFSVDPSNYLLCPAEEGGMANFILNTEVPELQTWNVAFLGVSKRSAIEVRLDEEFSFRSPQRFVSDLAAWKADKLIFPKQHVSVKEDEAIGVDAETAQKILAGGKNIRKELRRARKAPLLIVYFMTPVKFKGTKIRGKFIPADTSDGINPGEPLDDGTHPAYSLSFNSYGDSPSDDCFASYIVTKSWLQLHGLTDIEEEDDDDD